MTQNKKILSIASLFFCFFIFITNNAFAIDNYGYIIGSLNTTEYQNYPNFPSPYGVELEKYEGRFKHYYFFLNVGAQVYRCMIDIKDPFDYSVPYRVVEMRYVNNSDFQGILGKAHGWYPISDTDFSNRRTQGALDYHRHPGILKNMAGGRPWQELYGFSSTYSDRYIWSGLDLIIDPNYINSDDPELKLYHAYELDQLFTNVSKIYVFGSRFSDDTGQGMHNIHQNQGDYDNGHQYGKDIYQDGAVIFEYPNGDRKLLMVKFGDHVHGGITVNGQKDFSYSTDPDGTGPLQRAEGVEPQEFSYFFDATQYPNGTRIGPYYAEQIEVVAAHHEFDCMNGGDVDIYLSESSNVSPSYYRLFSRNNGCVNEYIRSSRDLMNTFNSYNPTRYYIYIDPWESDSQLFIKIRLSNY